MLQLHHWEPNTVFLKPLVALHEKGCAFESRWFDAAQLEQLDSRFPANTESQLQLEREGPVLVDGARVISSSWFMLEYIAESAPGPDLRPGDAYAHYQMQAWGQRIALLVAPVVAALGCARYLVPRLAAEDARRWRERIAAIEPLERRERWAALFDGRHAESALATQRENLRGPVQKIEGALASSAWLAGSAYSIADIDAFAMLKPLPDGFSRARRAARGGQGGAGERAQRAPGDLLRAGCGALALGLTVARSEPYSSVRLVTTSGGIRELPDRAARGQPMQDVAGKTAFITGGASGMGLGMARVFVRAGMNVVIADIRQDHLDQAKGTLDCDAGRVHAIRLDVADRAAMAAAAAETVRVFGKVHVLCNNAAAGIIGPLLEATHDDWDWALGVNIGGVVNGLQAFLPHIRAHGEGGHIVTTASMQGLFVAALAGIYCMTKHAVVALMEALRPELAPHNIGVSALCPGLVNTNIHEAEKTRPERYRHSRYIEPMEQRAAGFKEAVLAAGMDPLELGERVLRGIRRNDLYILTHPEYEQGVRDRFDAILASFPEEAPPPPARIAAETVVLRNPLFAEERARLLARKRNGSP
jgi:NAD(P)-dependent dehydrogenase (short-subunit alcohol dehydrogenase family)/glutathione S-transferase